jgi:maltose-binding protein MalE
VRKASFNMRLNLNVIGWLGVTLLALTLAACGAPADAQPPANTPTTDTLAAQFPSATPLGLAQVVTPLPTTELTPVPGPGLKIWWPEALAPIDRSDVTNLLDQQIGDFVAAGNIQVDIEFRLRRYADVGGIISTLRAASEVAPGALPDLTLIRREDLASLAQAGLIYPLEGLIPSAIIGGLYDSALQLAQIDGRVYGLPYTLDALVMAYHSEEGAPISGWSFVDMLEREQSFRFPARRINTVNNTVLLQYLDAGGTLPEPGQPMTLDPDALLVVFQFYERAYELGLVDDEVFDYALPQEYQTELATREIDAAMLHASTYFNMREAGTPLFLDTVPTVSGEPTTLVTGWMWVLTTNNADRRALAVSFVNWMMETNRQRAYVQALNVLPSQRQAMQRMSSQHMDVSLVDAMLANSIIPPPEDVTGPLGRLMQSALNAVLSGEATAEQVLQNVLDQIGE